MLELKDTQSIVWMPVIQSFLLRYEQPIQNNVKLRLFSRNCFKKLQKLRGTEETDRNQTQYSFYKHTAD